MGLIHLSTSEFDTIFGSFVLVRNWSWINRVREVFSRKSV